MKGRTTVNEGKEFRAARRNQSQQNLDKGVVLRCTLLKKLGNKAAGEEGGKESYAEIKTERAKEKSHDAEGLGWGKNQHKQI